MGFYVTHPARLIRLLQIGAEYAFTLQPTYLGNFEKLSGYPPEYRSQAFAVWSKFKGMFFPCSLSFLLFYFCLNAAVAITIRLESEQKAFRLLADFYIVMLLILFVQIFIAVIGAGELDLSKHLFLFYLTFDIFIINIIAIFFGVCRNGNVPEWLHFSESLFWVKEKKKIISFGMMGIGAIILLTSILADELGIGGYPGFGRKQAIGTAIGTVMAIIGLILNRKGLKIMQKRNIGRKK